MEQLTWVREEIAEAPRWEHSGELGPFFDTYTLRLPNDRKLSIYYCSATGVTVFGYNALGAESFEDFLEDDRTPLGEIAPYIDRFWPYRNFVWMSQGIPWDIKETILLDLDREAGKYRQVDYRFT